jgi:hypothetical protein
MNQRVAAAQGADIGLPLKLLLIVSGSVSGIMSQSFVQVVT